MRKNTHKPIAYILAGLVLFSLLGLEFPVFFLSRLVDGREASQVFSWPVNWYGAVFHWVLTMAVWMAGAYLIYRWVSKQGTMPDLMRFNFTRRDGMWLAVGLIFLILIESTLSRISAVALPQIWREYCGFQNMYGQQAWIVSIFQNLYYLVEFVLVVMMVAFFQFGGELWFKARWFPWGGIGLALTWGSIHLVTNPQGAVWVVVWALVLGVLFVLSKKGFLPTWLVGVLSFVI
ncbi:MAG: hypothetical protein ACNA70_08890 [Brevefilum sp.]